jgi:hypothetical protein
MNLGEFGFAIQGSKVAQVAYRAVKLKYVGAAPIFTKVFKPLAYFRSGVRFSLVDILKAFYYMGLKKKSSALPDVELKSGTESHGIRYRPVDHLAMVPTLRRNQWLRACPLVEMVSFKLFLDKKEVGPTICYIAEREGIRRGRIVHIPYMGKDMNSYRNAIALLEKELWARGCCSVNALAMDTTSRKAFLKQGYRTRRSTARKLYVKDPENLLDGVDLNEWYLTYYESDKGYRGI